MNTKKAIEIGKLYLKNPCPVMTPDQLDAFRLAIKALIYLDELAGVEIQ